MSFAVPRSPIWSFRTKHQGQGHRPSDLIVAIRTLVMIEVRNRFYEGDQDVLFRVISSIGEKPREDVPDNSIGTLVNYSMLVRMHKLFIHQ
jgi:hypothetical protein